MLRSGGQRVVLGKQEKHGHQSNTFHAPGESIEITYSTTFSVRLSPSDFLQVTFPVGWLLDGLLQAFGCEMCLLHAFLFHCDAKQLFWVKIKYGKL